MEVVMTTATQHVRDIALEIPASVRVFEQFGIDFCCGGRKPLVEACVEKELAVEVVLDAIAQATQAKAVDPEIWLNKPLAELIEHILWTHHTYIRREYPRLQQFAQKVVAKHGGKQPELLVIQQRLTELGEELLQHCHKEEAILFPYVTSLEQSILHGAAKPHGCFSTVEHPIAMMMHEHDSAGSATAEIRALSHDYTTPQDACPTYHAFFDGLREFTEDLHRHIHLENNILFPKAIALESNVG